MLKGEFSAGNMSASCVYLAGCSTGFVDSVTSSCTTYLPVRIRHLLGIDNPVTFSLDSTFLSFRDLHQGLA